MSRFRTGRWGLDMRAETVIVGSGVAAAAISQRLLENNPRASILLLEAGTRVKTMDFGLWENYLITQRLPYDANQDLPYPTRDSPGENRSVGGTDMPITGSRLIGYGGSTMQWGGWSLRLKPEDFALKSRTGQGADWPFGYEELEPYYCEAEHYLAVSGDSADTTVPRSRPYPFREFPFSLEDQPIARAFDSRGISYSHLAIARRGVAAIPSRHAPCHTTGTCKYCPFGARYVASNYIDDARAWNDYPNFDIKLGAIVAQIEMASKREALAVRYTDAATGKADLVEARRIIVAAGTLESAKLLLRSVSGHWPKGLGNDSDTTGRYLITHPYFIFTGTRASNPLKLQPELDFPTLICRYFDSQKEQAAGKYILVNPPDNVPFSLAAQMQAGFSREEIDANLTGVNNIQLISMMEVFGVPQNQIRNSWKRNHLGMIETTVDYTKDPGFDRRVGEMQARVQEVYAAMNAQMVDKPSVSWRCDHAASVCRMSNDEQDGVVDANLRVHGVDNLYVCSNATFPSIGAVNPTLTLTALALRLGDHLIATSSGERHGG